MPEFLLTDQEINKAACESEMSAAIAQAALRKVAGYIKRHSIMLPAGKAEPASVNLVKRYVLYIGAEEFNVLMREAGLAEKVVPDAKA